MNQQITLSFDAIWHTKSERIIEVVFESVVFTSPLKMSKPAARVSKVALAKLKQLSRKQPKRCPRKRKRQEATLEVQEEEESTARQQRANETKQRNADAQKLDVFTKRKMRQCSGTVPTSSASDADAEAFFAAVDAPFLRICGSCGELAKSLRTTRKRFAPDSKYFKSLLNDEGECEVIPEAVVLSADDTKYVFICCRCNASLAKGETPKFCRASGFRICPVPSELACLNWMEARLIGLGVSFTTCINLYSDQQEFTRGNAVSYWNEVHGVTLSLPRPISECGVILLRSKNSKGESLARVRPDLVRRALTWLIANNPLYARVSISEENLAALATTSMNDSVAALNLTEEEEVELRSSISHDGPREGNYEDPPNSLATNDSTIDPNGLTSKTHIGNPRSENNTANSDIIIEESFELQVEKSDGLTEAERIVHAVNTAVGQPLYPIGELRRQNDPMDEYTTKMLMQNCFPTLFPNGEGGYNALADAEYRTHEYSLADYCAHLMKWHDRRFVMHRNFKFFCLNLIQRRQIDGLVRRIRLPDSPLNQPDTNESSVASEKELCAAMALLDSLRPYFRSVRGTGLYWANIREDVMSMLGNRALPSRWPTFFLTLSAADTVWPDFFRACNPALTLEDARKLTSFERRRYLTENPDIAARHFNRRFNAFFEHILCGRAKPLGDITDYFWRVEFQQRGSPHIHALLWVRNSPDVLQSSQSEIGRLELAKYVDNIISVMSKSLEQLRSCTCSVCTCENNSQLDILSARPPKTTDSAWQCDLARVVQRVQQHLCGPGSKCRKQSNTCRFGYPKELRERTMIEATEVTDGVPSVKLRLKRDVETINNYSPSLLSVWRANMDIQLVGNAFGAAEYTAAYISKAEPDTLRFKNIIAAAVKRCDSNLPHHAVLKKVANACLSIREVSAQEAYYILLRELPLHGKSRQITRVKVMRHVMRYYRIEASELLDLRSDEIHDDAVRIEPVEAAYMARPRISRFENMSFASFVENYEMAENVSSSRANDNCWERDDLNGYIKLRRKAHVVRGTPWIKPDPTNPNFCFAEIFLHKPWRGLHDLPKSDEECVAEFAREQAMSLLTELREESNSLISRQRGVDIAKTVATTQSIEILPPSEYVFVEPDPHDSNFVENCSGEETSTAASNTVRQSLHWTPKHAYGSDAIDRARVFLKHVVRPCLKLQRSASRTRNEMNVTEHFKRHYMYPISCFEDGNGSSDCMDASQWIPFALTMHQARKRFRASIENSNCAPLQMVIHGEGGSGKSWLIRHIVKDVHCVFGEHTVSRRNSKRILLLAHQGTAAFNIKGRTICSAFELTAFSRNAFSSSYTSLSTIKGGQTKLKRLQEEFATVHLVIIDEFSVISSGMLYWIDQRMREIWPSCSHLPFGGRDIIFTGDLAQLDPVVPYALSTPASQIQNPIQRRG